MSWDHFGPYWWVPFCYEAFLPTHVWPPLAQLTKFSPDRLCDLKTGRKWPKITEHSAHLLQVHASGSHSLTHRRDSLRCRQTTFNPLPQTQGGLDCLMQLFTPKATFQVSFLSTSVDKPLIFRLQQLNPKGLKKMIQQQAIGLGVCAYKNILAATQAIHKVLLSSQLHRKARKFAPGTPTQNRC